MELYMEYNGDTGNVWLNWGLNRLYQHKKVCLEMSIKKEPGFINEEQMIFSEYDHPQGGGNEMEQEAVVKHQKTANGRGEKFRALPAGNIWG